MRSNQIERYKQKLKLSSIQKDLIVGTLLGDGCLETQNQGRTFRLKIEHSIIQKEYVNWKYTILKDWVLTQPQIKRRMSYGKERDNYWFSTLSHGALRFYAQQFYKDCIKIIPKFIGRILTPIALAVWFMDDGSIKSKLHRSLVIHTQSFGQKELTMLIDVLFKKFKIKAVLRKRRDEGHGYALSLAAESVQTFAEIVSPYVLPSMRYKLGNIIAQKVTEAYIKVS